MMAHHHPISDGDDDGLCSLCPLRLMAMVPTITILIGGNLSVGGIAMCGGPTGYYQLLLPGFNRGNINH
jgi:hypothetical protein